MDLQITYPYDILPMLWDKSWLRLLFVKQQSTKNVPVLEHAMPEVLRAIVVNKEQRKIEVT